MKYEGRNSAHIDTGIFAATCMVDKIHLPISSYLVDFTRAGMKIIKVDP
jgi:hypothetical protein